MTEMEKTKIITVRLSKSDLNKVEAVRTLEKVDRSTLIKEFINDGLRDRVIHLYEKGRISAGQSAEMLDIPLREFLALLEQACVAVNWDSEGIKQYMKEKYGE